MPEEKPFEPQKIVRSALLGDIDSRRRFQELFGQYIYDYPLKSFRLAKEKSGDFYIYVFEDDRIFRRLATFNGRNDAQFKTYLGFYVLRDLFFEWQRTRRDIETVSLESPIFNGRSENTSGMGDFVAQPGATLDDAIESREAADRAHKFLADLDIEERVLLKLIHLAEFDLLEVKLEGEWKQVVRYDCSHKFVHRDSYDLKGRQRKEEIDLSYEEALTFADEDLDENWERYASTFLSGGRP